MVKNCCLIPWMILIWVRVISFFSKKLKFYNAQWDILKEGPFGVFPVINLDRESKDRYQC